MSLDKANLTPLACFLVACTASAEHTLDVQTGVGAFPKLVTHVGSYQSTAAGTLGFSGQYQLRKLPARHLEKLLTLARQEIRIGSFLYHKFTPHMGLMPTLQWNTNQNIHKKWGHSIDTQITAYIQGFKVSAYYQSPRDHKVKIVGDNQHFVKNLKMRGMKVGYVWPGDHSIGVQLGMGRIGKKSRIKSVDTLWQSSANTQVIGHLARITTVVSSYNRYTLSLAYNLWRTQPNNAVLPQGFSPYVDLVADPDGVCGTMKNWGKNAEEWGKATWLHMKHDTSAALQDTEHWTSTAIEDFKKKL